jgi:protoporphyrinogen oxidase
MNRTKVVIIGAGPAGLSAAWFLTKQGVEVTVVEKEQSVGGISKTLTLKGYKVDIGPHRFFTKFENVRTFWNEILPTDKFTEKKRLTRILYNGRLFDYPLTLHSILRNMSLLEVLSILISYVAIKIKYQFRRKKIVTFKDWISFNFGTRIYEIFFRSYTEKLWGIPCEKIASEWASQRIKGVNIKSIVLSFLFKSYTKGKVRSFVESFHYPVDGVGGMYEKIKKEIEQMGGKFILGEKIEKFFIDGKRIISVSAGNFLLEADYFVSSIPLNELVCSIYPKVHLVKYAEVLKFRALVVAYIKVENKNLFPDCWIYIHTPGTGITRIQNFNNWGEKMGGRKDGTVLGLEYPCFKEDVLWNSDDDILFNIIKEDIRKIGIVEEREMEFLGKTRISEAYPVYSGRYKESIGEIKSFLNSLDNLITCGRNGTFSYNNMDHSILSGFCAAKKILGEDCDPWNINVNEEYLEEKTDI